MLVHGRDCNFLSLRSSLAIPLVIRFPIFWDVPTGFVFHPTPFYKGGRVHLVPDIIQPYNNPPFVTSLLITMETFPESQRLDCGIIASGRRRGRGEERIETARRHEIPINQHEVARM